MKGVSYNSVLRCLSLGSRELRYELPAHYCGQIGNYTLYHRPNPIVHHHKKKKDFTLAYPEILLVGDSSTHHCISVAFDEGRPINIYANINLPPIAHGSGHEWEDLELDIKATMEKTGWRPMVVDVDEFEAANIPPIYQKLAWEEIDSLLKKCEQKEFPFIDECFVLCLNENSISCYY